MRPMYYKCDEFGNVTPTDNGTVRDIGRRVDYTEENGVSVSTVFLGIDHEYRDGEPPILWETMVFGGEHDQLQRRYTSLEDARQGHMEVCKLVFPE